MTRNEFLKIAPTVDAVIWFKSPRAGESYYTVTTDDGDVDTFDTVDEAVKFCQENELTYVHGVYY